jgi:Primase C terminal 2 (PriCT-2)
MEEIAAAVRAIKNDDNTSRERWCKVGFQIIAATNKSDAGFELFDEWSRRWHKYNEEKTKKFWEDATADRATGAGLFDMADEDSPGWRSKSHDKKLNGSEIIAHRAADIEPQAIEWLWDGRLARGNPHVVCGSLAIAEQSRFMSTHP